MAVAIKPELGIQTIGWLLRLPFLRATDLSLLLGIDEVSVRQLLNDLEQRGWVEHLRASSPEFDTQRLFMLSARASQEAAAAMGIPADGIDHEFPVGSREAEERLLRLETTVGMNRFFAGLGAGIRLGRNLRLSEARSLPWGTGRGRNRWPHTVEGFGCLRAGNRCAPFFVAWDRSEAPTEHRKRRVASWYAFWQPQGRSTAIAHSILLICPGEREANEWARAVTASADRRGREPLSVAWATTADAVSRPAGPIWRRLEGMRRTVLEERLRWLQDMPVLWATPGEELEQKLGADLATRIADPRVGRASVTATPAKESTRGQLARLALACNADHKNLLEWLGHHPFLSARDLEALVGLPERVLERLLGDLSDWKLADSVLRPANGEGTPPARYFVTSTALALSAARDGVPVRRYGRFGVLAAADEGEGKKDERLRGLLRHFDHTVGANNFMVQLAREMHQPATGPRYRLAFWRSAAGAQEWFRWRDRFWHIWPDARALLSADGTKFDVLLEWDRGLMRRREHLSKFMNYAAWLMHSAVAPPSVTRLLVVTTSETSEAVMMAAAREAAKIAPQLLDLTYFTTAGRLVQEGVLGPCWMPSHYGSRRTRGRWLGRTA